MPLEPLPQPQWLGRLAYRWALRLQRTRREAVLAGRAPEALWLLEHDPVITLGRRGGEVRTPAPGTAVVRTERGGLATWHGPGQLVGYLVIDVAKRRGSVRGTVSAVEDGIIAWLAARGVQAGRRAGAPGVWVADHKICALGLHFRRGVTLHGFALNVSCDLRAFEQIVPCGITDGGVTSLAALTASTSPVHRIAPEVGHAVRDALAASLFQPA